MENDSFATLHLKLKYKKTCIVIPPSTCIKRPFQGTFSSIHMYKSHCSIIFTTDRQAVRAYERFSSLDKLGESPWHGEVKRRALDHTVSDLGQQGKPLDPLGLFSFYLVTSAILLDLPLPADFHVSQQKLPIFLSQMSNEPSKGIKTNSGKSTGPRARMKSRGLTSQSLTGCETLSVRLASTQVSSSSPVIWK